MDPWHWQPWFPDTAQQLPVDGICTFKNYQRVIKAPKYQHTATSLPFIKYIQLRFYQSPFLMMDNLQRNKTTATQAMAIEDGKDHPFRPGETNLARYFDLLKQRRALPVSAKRQEFLDAYHQNQVLVLSSEPGSERAVRIPQFIFFDEWKGDGKIACTHTRRIAVASAAERTAAELDVHVGAEVGFAVRFDKVRHGRTKLLYMTDRTLLEAARIQPNFNDFACIIIDEAHERALATDMLLGLLKVAISQRTDLKVGVMLATSDTQRFLDCFGDKKAAHFELSGQNHPVQITYIKEPILEVFSAALNLAKCIHEKEEDGDILIFFSSAGECEEACLLLGKNTRDLEVLPLYSELPEHQKSRVLQKSTKRMCVCATNIAEASMTVDGIVHVIGLETLLTGPISQAAARLRADCAGRIKPGFCHRLYTYKSFKEEMKTFSPPKIHENGISESILKLKAMGFDNVAELDFVDPTHPGILFRGLEDLEHILEMLILAALDGSNIYLRPHGVRYFADLARQQFADFISDHLAQLHAFHAYSHAKQQTSPELPDKERVGLDIRQWCFDAFLNHSVLDEVARVRQQLKEQFHLLFPDWRAPNTTLFIDPNYEINIRKALARTFYYRSAFRDPAGVDQYRVYMSNVTAVEPGWLASGTRLLQGN
ncbi:ATP-binding PRP16 [Fusarium agapanthi]|uniref:RNA helicase n=1 Tax=Fusarium agapanthi TaxID=1803897 RepID=A0A9P5B4G8_9HYPO|nr:ATP-binding PRP16 [Fusarium agapanthi]